MRTLFLLTSIILAPTILTSCEDGSDGKIFGDDSGSGVDEDGNDLLDRPEPHITPNPGTAQSCPDGTVDFDGDGFCASSNYEFYDCDDSNSSIYPGAAEHCDMNEDYDCSGVTSSSPFYFTSDDSEYQVFSYYMDIDDDRMWGSTITYLCLSAYEASYIANSISDYCVSPSTTLARVYRADRNYHPWRISDRPGIDCYDTIYDIPGSDLSPADVYPCNEDETKDCGYTRNEECFNNDALDTWYAENSDCYSYLSK